MSNIVGKTVKFKGYQIGWYFVGVIASLDSSTRKGIFVGYLNVPHVQIKDIKVFKIDLSGNRYESEQQYLRDLEEGTLKVNVQDITSSRMPKELGDVVRATVNNIQKVQNKRDGDIVINLIKQKEYKDNIVESFLRVAVGDPDLSSEAYESGEKFIHNKGFYFIEKREITGFNKIRLDKINVEGLSNLAIFSQDLMAGSESDYYVYALRDALEGYYLYVDVDEITILREIQENITNRATRPDKIRKQITETLSMYQRLPVKK